MTIVNGTYQKLSDDEIQSALETELQNEFGVDIDLTESSVFTTLASVLGTVISENQEQSLQEVYRSGFLETATGKDLERVVAIIGITRRSASHATGVQRFLASGKVTQDYVIQKGTPIQTSGTDPIEFETSSVSILELVDSFEDGNISEYSGDTGTATTVTDSNAPHGNTVLELDATNGASIYRETELTVGSTFHAHVNATASTVPIIQFGIQKTQNNSYYQIAVDEAADEVRLERYDEGSLASTVDTTAVTINTDTWYELSIDWNITGNISVSVLDPNDNEVATLGGTDSTYLNGWCGFKSGDANGTKQFDWYTTSEVSANIRAVSGGAIGNVGPNSIDVIPSPPAGVNSTTNLYPTGSIQYSDINGTQFIVGQGRETDDELRQRAEDAVTGGGTSTHDALVSALINDIENVTSVTVYENKTDVDNTGSGGLPPHSFEAVVYGGDDALVAETIFKNKAITARDYGGVNGTEVIVTVTAESNGQQRDIHFSRPTKLDVDMTLDIVVDDTYIGDSELRDDIVQYIGGIQSDGSDALGLGVGDDVRIDEIRDIVVGDDTGVVGLDQSVDGTPISTTPSITTVNGLQVVDVGSNEVAQTDASDGSITLNVREI